MKLSGPGITYILLIIPAFLALTVLVQGINKIKRNDKGGVTVLLFGIFFLLLVLSVYLFILN